MVRETDKYEVLRRYYGHTSFRPGQEELIDGLLAGRDVLGVMPTGGGKSVCYQVPALLMPGMAVVISPLISLMKDQVSALREAGVEAALLNSTLSASESRAVYRRAWGGELKLLYVAPERLETEGFRKLCAGVELSLVAVDEAHCVSQWGQDFRPHYLWIEDFLNSLPRRPPVGAFTATATGAVREDIVRLLGLRDPLTLVTGFDRPNLYFDVLRPKDKTSALLELLARRRGRSGIVYCATRRGVEEVCEALCRQGLPATRYHAGLEEDERRQNQEDFQFDRKEIMVATNAFGMGIDKSNVSFVIHYNMPKSIEAYYQEAGRAGRDGSPAECILLYAPRDVQTARFLIEKGREDALSEEERAQAIRQDYRRLEAMERYCKTTKCLRGHLLGYFGQSHPARCGNCGTCRAGSTTVDITRQAQMVLSCVIRVEDRLGYYVGQTRIVQVLMGSRDEGVLKPGLDKLSTYGLLRGVKRSEVNAYIDCLLEEGYLEREPEHGTLRPTPAAGEVLFRGKTVEMATRPAGGKSEEAGRPSRREAAPDEGLFQALKDLRYRLAQREGVPAFVIFTNATLTALAARKPRTMEGLLNVPGVGEKKAQKYGKAVLATVKEYERENGRG